MEGLTFVDENEINNNLQESNNLQGSNNLPDTDNECPCKNGGNNENKENYKYNENNENNEKFNFTGGARDIIKEPEKLGTKEHNNYCSIVIDSNDGICFSSSFLNKLRVLMNKNIGQNIKDSKELIKLTMKFYNVNDSSKILDIDDIKNVSDTYEIKEQIDRFKPDGPWDDSLLNNYNIDESIKQLELKYKPKTSKSGGAIEGTPEEKAKFDNSNFEHKLDTKDSSKIHFKHIPFMMNDLYNPFENINLHSYLDNNNNENIIKLIKEGYNCFNIVFNTDESSGGGKQWYSVFLNFITSGTPDDPWIIEHFNSSGMRPRATVLDWMKKLEIIF